MDLYKKIFSYIPERKFHTILGMVFTAISCCLHFYAFYQIWLILEKVFLGIAITDILSSASRILILFVLQGVLYLLGLWMTHLAGFHLETRLREEGIKHLVHGSQTFFDTHRSGEVRKIIDNNIEQTHTTVAHLIPDLVVSILTPLFVIIMTFRLDLYLGIFFIIIVAASMFLLSRMSGEMEFMKEYAKMTDELNAGAVEYVRGIPVVKIFNAPIMGFKRLYDAIITYRDRVYDYSMSCRWPYTSFQWILNIFIITPIFIVLYLVGKGADPYLWSAKLIFFTLFSGLFFTSMMKIMYVGMYFTQAQMAIDNLEGLFEEMEVKKIYYGNEKEMSDSTIAFKNVSFSYDGEHEILSNLSFTLPENHVYALVGSSGGGKSTIGKLISGLYPVDAGEICIGGKSIYSYNEQVLMDNIGMVYQHPKLFHGISIFENVKLGKQDATDEEVYEALYLARCNEFIDKFEAGYDAIIGAKGINLSGGEIQRVSIARIFLKNPKIIILDEASAAADPENEYELQLAFSNLMKGRTVIMIAHRLSSIRGVHEILVVEKGDIIERGTHEQLMARGERYREFVDLYESANEWRICS